MIAATASHRLLSRVQTSKFLSQVFLHQKTCARKLAQVTCSNYASFWSRKWLNTLEKIQPPVDRPLNGRDSRQKLARKRTCSIPASFWHQFLVPEKNGARNPVHTSKFSGTRNLRVATETFQSERSFRLVRTTLSVWCVCKLKFRTF